MNTPFVFDAGNLALDFVNTRPLRNGRPVDHLAGPDGLRAWLVEAGLLGADGSAGWRSASEAARLFKEALALREAIATVVTTEAPGAAVDTINRIMAARSASPQVRRTDSGALQIERMHRHHDPLAVLSPVAEAAARLLTEADPARIRQCDDDDCVLWFLDTTKNGRRRWCSMARCGNRAKAAAHYRRSKGREARRRR